jgi:hypothetical protein
MEEDIKLNLEKFRILSNLYSNVLSFKRTELKTDLEKLLEEKLKVYINNIF